LHFRANFQASIRWWFSAVPVLFKSFRQAVCCAKLFLISIKAFGKLLASNKAKEGYLMTKVLSRIGKVASTLVLAGMLAIAVPSGAFAQRGGGHGGGGGHAVAGGGFRGGAVAGGFRGGAVGGGFRGGYGGGYYGGYRGGFYGGYRGGWGFGLGFGYPYYGYGYGYGYPYYGYPGYYGYPAYSAPVYSAPAYNAPPPCGYYDNYGYWHSYPGCYSGGGY
jgi:hypothetical protein